MVSTSGFPSPLPNTSDLQPVFHGFSVSYRYKQGFSDVAVNFSAELGGKRYTDTSAEAHRVHEAVEFGRLAKTALGIGGRVGS